MIYKYPLHVSYIYCINLNNTQGICKNILLYNGIVECCNSNCSLILLCASYNSCKSATFILVVVNCQSIELEVSEISMPDT